MDISGKHNREGKTNLHILPTTFNNTRESEIPLRILIVDDDEMLRDSLKEYLTALDNIEVHEAANAYDGLNMVHKLEPLDGVFVDVNMPGMDGLAFVKKLKEIDRTIVAIIITGFPSMAVIVSALRAGASDFLTKPFQLDHLHVAIQRLRKERGILIENQELTQELKDKKTLEALVSKLKQKIHEQNILFNISTTLSKVKSTQELYKKVVSLACSLTMASSACFWVVNQEENALILTASYNAASHATKRISLKDTAAIPVKVVKENIPMLVKPVPGEVKSGLSTDGGQIFVPFRIRNEIFGVLGIANAAGSTTKDMSDETMFLLSLLEEGASLTVENLFLYESVSLNLHATLKALVRTLEAKDPYTKEHSRRVTELAIKLAKEMSLSEEELDSIHIAGYLHDIGKIGIRDHILMKPGKLTDEEYEIIKTHPIIGEDIVSHLGLLPAEKSVIRHHHERWDGKGYPDRLKGENIPKLARVLAVADTYDAVTSERPYRKARSPQEAFIEIKKNSGTQFDPRVVNALESYMKKAGMLGLRKVSSTTATVAG